MGSVAISKSQILLFGGWCKTASQTALILNQQQHTEGQVPSHNFMHVKQGLDKPDFFMVTGVAMKCVEEP